MKYEVVNAPQRSDAWFEARRGRLTGSEAYGVVAFKKTKQVEELADRRNLRIKLVLERVTGRLATRGFVSKVMSQGTETEREARAVYEAVTGRPVVVPGFLRCLDIHAGCSLDGALMDGARIVGIQEFKCPLDATHLDTLRLGEVPEDYLWQVTHNLWVSGADWCDWMSYSPAFPDGLQWKTIRVERNEQVISDYAAKANAFLAEVEQECAELRRMVA